jgi:hypothetical protein
MTLLRVGNPAGGGVLIASEVKTAVLYKTTLYKTTARLPVYEAGETLAGAIAWLGVAANVQAGTPYFIALTRDETLSGEWTLNNSNLNLTLEGAGETRTINAAGVPASRPVISLNAGTLTLGNNLTLDGGGRAGRFIGIEGGAALNLTGATLTGNNSGAVSVGYGGFTMSGGAITGNSTTSVGGGVGVSSGWFTMTGGVISGNSASHTNGGGGVFVSGGVFTMTGGVISGNTAPRGGGVRLYSNDPFSVAGGEISGNTATNGPGFGAQVFQMGSSNHYIDGAITPSMTVVNWAAPGDPYWDD